MIFFFAGVNRFKCFNLNISYQHFDYKEPFIYNSRTQTQKPVLNVRFKDFCNSKSFRLRFGMANSMNNRLRLIIPPTQHEFETLNINKISG